MRAAWVSPLLLAGCMTGEIPHEDPDATNVERTACGALENLTFQSVSQGECGLTPMGPAACHWYIAFEPVDETRSAFEWSYSDIQSSGYVNCSGDTVLIHGTGLVEGRFDENLDLVWDDFAYSIAPR